jgi:hypothetical protein
VTTAGERPPSLQALWAFAEERAEASGCAPDAALERAGLLLHRDLAHGGYDSTPRNSIAFAGTGGDGVHFSFALHDDRALEDSPIVMTVPMSFGHENLIVGENLRDFLAVGSGLSFFVLEQVTYDRPGFLDSYAGGSKRYQPDDKARALLARLALAFGVRPPVDLGTHLDSLHTRFSSWLEPGEPRAIATSVPTQAALLAYLEIMGKKPPTTPQ